MVPPLLKQVNKITMAIECFLSMWEPFETGSFFVRQETRKNVATENLEATVSRLLVPITN